MGRVDLPPVYSGWQAVDATPQETSDGEQPIQPSFPWDWAAHGQALGCDKDVAAWLEL